MSWLYGGSDMDFVPTVSVANSAAEVNAEKEAETLAKKGHV